MLGLIVLAILGGWAIVQRQTITEVVADLPVKISDKLDRLWEIAQDSLRERKYLRAEKALLTILRVDERNATAYNRLGILYAKQQAFKDAIECFEIAQSLEPSASSLHNVGLIYYETESYEKATKEGIVDLRSAIHPKKGEVARSFYQPAVYYQVFGNKFVQNLSLIDLIFCEGPGARAIVRASVKK